MDCRKALPLFLAFGLSCTGCTGLRPEKTPDQPPPPAQVTTHKTEYWPALGSAGKDEPEKKKQPSARLCVAFGRLREGETANTLLSEREKEQLLDQARMAYQQALEIDPDCHDAYAGLAWLYVRLKKEEKAFETYQAGLKKHPKSAQLWFDLGKLHARRKDFDAAAECLRQALEAEPENRTVLTWLGLTLARAGRFDDAFAVLARVRGEASAHYQMAQMMRHLHRLEPGRAELLQKSRQHLELALRDEPDLPGARALLASLSGGPPVPDQGDGIATAGFFEDQPATVGSPRH